MCRVGACLQKHQHFSYIVIIMFGLNCLWTHLGYVSTVKMDF